LRMYAMRCGVSPGSWTTVPPVAGWYPHHNMPDDLKVFIVTLRMTDPPRYKLITKFWE